MVTGIRRTDLRRALIGAAEQVDGISQRHVSIARGVANVTVASPLGDPAGLIDRSPPALAEQLGQLNPVDPLTPRVTLDRKGPSMNARTARTARGNRIGLGLTGVLVLLAGGGYLVARSFGAFGQAGRGPRLRRAAPPTGCTTSDPGCGSPSPRSASSRWSCSVRWLLVQLRSDSLSRIAVDADQDSNRVPAAPICRPAPSPPRSVRRSRLTPGSARCTPG